MRWGCLLMSYLVALLLAVGSCANKEKQAEEHFRKGFSYQDGGDLNKAIEEYNKALELNPGYTQVYINLGTVYLGKQDYDRAIETFEKVLELNYLDKKAHYNIGLAYLYKGDLEKAKEEVKFLQSIRSEMGDALERKVAESESTP